MFTQVVFFASLAAGVVAAPAKIGVFDIHVCICQLAVAATAVVAAVVVPC
jgi:hypothetical protein